MKEYIEERAVAIANYIIDHNATVRQTAKKFGISKSTVHKDVTDRLEHINPTLASKARVVLDVNTPKFTFTKGFLLRELFKCTASAINSLPVPLSPVIKHITLITNQFFVIVAVTFEHSKLLVI